MTALLLQLCLACICLVAAVEGYRHLLRLETAATAAELGAAQLFAAPRLADGGAAWLFGLALVGPAILYLLFVVALELPV